MSLSRYAYQLKCHDCSPITFTVDGGYRSTQREKTRFRNMHFSVLLISHWKGVEYPWGLCRWKIISYCGRTKNTFIFFSMIYFFTRSGFKILISHPRNPTYGGISGHDNPLNTTRCNPSRKRSRHNRILNHFETGLNAVMG